MRFLAVPCMVALAAMTFAACGGQRAGETTVESITLAKDDGSGNPGETVTSLKPSDRTFHAEVKLDRGDPAKVKGELIAVDTPEGKNIAVVSQDYDVSGLENTVKFNFSLPQDWPVGTYKLDVSVNGKPAKSQQFMIQ